jgi:hypothetical protein
MARTVARGPHIDLFLPANLQFGARASNPRAQVRLLPGPLLALIVGTEPVAFSKKQELPLGDPFGSHDHPWSMSLPAVSSMLPDPSSKAFSTRPGSPGSTRISQWCPAGRS